MKLELPDLNQMKDVFTERIQSPEHSMNEFTLTIVSSSLAGFWLCVYAGKCQRNVGDPLQYTGLERPYFARQKAGYLGM